MSASPILLLYFAWLRERIGVAEEALMLPDGIATVADLVPWLRGLDNRHAAGFERAELIRCAVNQNMADPATPVRPGDEVAFFPPVTGG